jgi:hypothetical protein
MILKDSIELFNDMKLDKASKKEILKSMKKSFNEETIINNLNKLKKSLEI